MIRIVDTVLVAAAISGAIWTYQIKHEADQSAKRIASLHSQIKAQNRKIALLEADWAIDISPARLEKVAEKFKEQLGLRALASSQIVELSELPGFRVDRDAPSEEIYANESDDIVTGGIDAIIERESGN